MLIDLFFLLDIWVLVAEMWCLPIPVLFRKCNYDVIWCLGNIHVLVNVC